jgi:amidase
VKLLHVCISKLTFRMYSAPYLHSASLFSHMLLIAAKESGILLHFSKLMIIQDFGVLAIPTVLGHPPKLQSDSTTLEVLGVKAFSLLSIAGVSGFCQVLSLSLSMCVCVCVVRHDDLTFSLLVYLKTFEKPHKFVSAYLQVSIPLGLYDNLPVSISLLAKHGSDGFLLNLVEILYDTLQEEVGIAEKKGY